MEEAKKFVMDRYKLTREVVDTYTLSRLMGLIEYKDMVVYERVKVSLRKAGYII